MKLILLAEKLNTLMSRENIRGLMTAGLVTSALLCMANPGRAQGIEYNSIAGEGAISHGSGATQPYNLLVGPVSMRMAASETTSFNDNINIAQYGRQSDIIFQPAVDFSGNWQATEDNNLTFGLGVGYQAYLNHTGDSGLIISPNNMSGTQFNMVIGNVKIDFHDFVSFQQNPIDVGQLSDIAQFPVLTNEAGMKVSWNFNEDILLSMGYDHSNQWVFDSQYDYLDSVSDTITPTVTFNVNQSIQAGINTSFTSMRYDQNIMNDSQGFTAGPFVTAQLSEHISVSAQVGVDYSNYDSGGLVGDSSNLLSWYGNFGINHQINDVLKESFSVGQQFIPGITSNYTQEIYATYSPSWQATPFLNVSANLSFQNLNDSSSTFSQSSNIIQTGLNLGYALTDHASVSAGYQYVLKAANTSALGYYQNEVNLGFRYQF